MKAPPRSFWRSQLIPFGILALTALLLLWKLPSLPPELHWHLKGAAETVTPTTIRNLLAPVVFGTFLCLFLGILGGLSPSMPRLEKLRDPERRERAGRLLLHVLWTCQLLTAFVVALIASPLLGAPDWAPVATLPLCLLFMGHLFRIGRQHPAARKA